MVTAAIELWDRAVYLPGADTAVIADLHLGRGAVAAVEFPLNEREHITDSVEAILTEFAPEELVVAGDVLHAFEGVPNGVEDVLGELVDRADRHGAELILIQGNHDRQLPELSPVPVQKQWRPEAGLVVHHGDEKRASDGRLEVVGHVHPTIVIEGQRRPCFLYDPDATPPLLVVPALNPLLPGVPVNTARTADLPGTVVKEIGRVRPGVYDTTAAEPLWFPPLAELRPLL